MPIIATSSYSFQRLYGSKFVSIENAADFARYCGAEAIEYALGGSLSPPLDQDLANKLTASCERTEIPVCSVVVAADILNGTDAERKDSVKSVITQLEAAAIMGAKCFRHDATLGPTNGDLRDPSFEEALPIIAGGCRTIAERAHDLGMKSSIENHGRFVQHADRILKLIENVNHPSFGITLDIGNSLFADQDHVEATRLLAHHAITVHIKDFIINPEHDEHAWETFEDGPKVLACALGEGDVKIDECIQLMKQAGFDGSYVVEYEGVQHEPRDAVRAGIDILKKAVGIEVDSA